MYAGIKRKLWILLVFAAALLLPLCSVKNVEAAKISKKSITIEAGKKKTYSVKTKTKKWSVKVKNPKVVKCKVKKKKKQLVLTALKPGKTTITITGVRWKKIRKYKLTVKVKAKAKIKTPSNAPSVSQDEVTPDDQKPDDSTEDEKPGENPGGNTGDEKPGENPDEDTNTDAKATTLTFGTEDGGDFVQGCSSQKITFALNNDAKEVQVQVLDAVDDVVYSKVFNGCSRNTEYSFAWDGKKTDGTFAKPALYRIRVVAGAEQTDSDYFSLFSSDAFDGGTGSETNPYQVRTLDQFKKIMLYSNRCFIQTADIDGEFETFYTMGADDNPFTGTYDGAGKSISNLMITNEDGDERAAVMMAIGEKGVVKNLTFRDCSASTTGGYASILAYSIAGKVQGCSLEGCTSSVVCTSGSYAGAIGFELTSTGTISGCTSVNCTISAKKNSKNGNSWAGGIVCRNAGIILSCNLTDVNASNDAYVYNDIEVGGVAAINDNGGRIISCSVTGVIEGGEEGSAGGIAGANKGQIISCQFSGTTHGNFTGDFAGCDDGIVTN